MNFYQSVSANKAVNVQRFLDTYTGAVAAYSLRRLRTGHTGYAVEVRRASDNSTRDIGFDADGNFHVSALEEFCSGTDGYVTVWYDQTSNGYDVSQTDTTKQPKIYDSVTGLIPLTDSEGNGVPNTLASIKGDSSSTLSNSSLQEEFNGGYSYFFVNNCSAYNTHLFYTDTGTSNKSFGALGSTYQFVRHRNVSKITSPAYRTDRRSTIWSVHHDGSTGYNAFTIQETGENGSHSSSLAAVDSTVSGVPLVINPKQGNIQELIIYDSDKSSQRKQIESDINNYYTVGQLNYDLPLDTYTNVTAAYSVRKLRSAYTGYCMEVYNGTTYADIGFNEFNELDVPAIASHCGTSDGFVSKLYDQSGNSYTASQTDSAKMPKIYDGTSQSVIFKNGKPIIEYLPNSGAGEVFASLDLDTSVSINVTTAHFFFVTGRDSGRRGMWRNGYPGPYNLYVAQAGNSGGAGVSELHVNGTFRGVLNKQEFAGAIGAQAVYNSKRTLNGTGQRIGSDADGMHDTQEIIIFDSAMDDDREAIENNQNAYFNVY